MNPAKSPQQLALQTLPISLADALSSMLGEGVTHCFSATQFQTLQEISGMGQVELSQALLPFAASYSQPFVSGFKVGALAQDDQGRWFIGANLEIPNEALNHSLHAEQSVLHNAWCHGARRLLHITINASPCGHCRQFLNEVADGAAMQVSIPQGQRQLGQLLPDSFTPADLGVEQPLLVHHGAELAHDSEDTLTQLAITQANASYAPYSKNYAAIALETASGQQFFGRYAENAAYNPSLMPVQGALSQMALSGNFEQPIVRAVLVESSQGSISLANASMDALHAIADVQLEHWVL
ncbi:cytidine deaminase [Paraferrimonas sedimenticola]|uniref:Cytidine deaminase n=1 Tax=Paraferrimonas sedimenticola TaxID=375674 RepID=A0AA37RVI8_9GAMM|nr:cytidine deaminase [Paraferrimonas sedimenticola]GLP96485.1 cytidine deaminase [Paraferrimonas sedimenticola]